MAKSAFAAGCRPARIAGPMLACFLGALLFGGAAFARTESAAAELRARLDEGTRLLATAPPRQVIDDYLVPVARDGPPEGGV